jgi:hypothetical protein
MMDLFGRKKIAELEKHAEWANDEMSRMGEQLEKANDEIVELTIAAHKLELSLKATEERAEYWRQVASDAAAEASGKTGALNMARMAAAVGDEEGEKDEARKHAEGLAKRLDEIFGDGLTPEQMAAMAAERRAATETKDTDGE